MTGPAITPDAQVAAGGKGFKAELDGLRERMRGVGFGYDEIAAEIGRRYRVRPRQAYRLAWGWSLEQAAARFNEEAARQDADPEARAGLTASRLRACRSRTGSCCCAARAPRRRSGRRSDRKSVV